MYCISRVNVGTGPSEQRVLLTGLHSVADIYCESCKTPLGWKYVSAHYLVQWSSYYAPANYCTYCDASIFD